jgi:hypothetical protein
MIVVRGRPQSIQLMFLSMKDGLTVVLDVRMWVVLRFDA